MSCAVRLPAARKAGYTEPKAPSPPPLTKLGGQGDGMPFGPESAGVVPTLRRGIRDLFGNPLACPEGRVPIRRITLSQLSRFGKLENFFRKDPYRQHSLPDRISTPGFRSIAPMPSYMPPA